MAWFPFVCLALGALIGCSRAAGRITRYLDPLLNAGLVVLMLALGAKIGSKDSLVGNLGLLGLQCLGIAALAIAGSVLCTLLLEKTVLPLQNVREKLIREQIAVPRSAVATDNETGGHSPLVWIMPGSLLGGIAGGYWLLPPQLASGLDAAITFSLVVLYVGVGVSFGVNKGVFRYLQVLSWRITWISAAIVAGSLAGGAAAGVLMSLPLTMTVAAAAGMSYYSITGAMLTQAYGIEVGAYGFLVNVAREFLTVLLVPLLVRVSCGSPIAAGAAGNMDTMLVPVTKFVGAELGLVALITGTILTFLVPVLLSVMIGSVC